MCLPVKPFKVEREWEHAGLKCAVVQAREGGNRCGYVRVPPRHAAYGRLLDSYSAVDRKLNDAIDGPHGGFTFSHMEDCLEEDGRGWWLGFDCAHLGDAYYDPEHLPDWEVKFRAEHPEFSGHHAGDHFWTHEEVVAETTRLAEQLAAVATLLPSRSIRWAKEQKRQQHKRMLPRHLKQMTKQLHDAVAKLK